MKILGHKPSISAWVGIFIVVFFLILAVFTPLIAPYGEAQTVGKTFGRSSAQFWLGNDNIGRDILSRIIYGARTTIGVALVTTIISFTIGTIAGLAAVVGGPVVDQILSRFVDIMLSIPLLVFALIVLSMFGSSIPTLIMTIAILDSTRVFRLARAVSMNIAVLEYVEVAKLRGEGLWWVMRKEILPNALPPMISEFGLRFCFNFLFVAGLSFLGLGIQPPLTSLGLMISEGRDYIAYAWWIAVLPGLTIFVTTLSISLIGDWLRDRLDPSLS